MTFARNIFRFAGIALLLLTLIFAGNRSALAEEQDPVSVTIQASPASLTGPGEVTISLKVSNPTDTDMIAPVTLLDPAGAVVASFGDGGSYILKSGDSRTWEGKWSVTQAQLDAGAVSYTLQYHLLDDSGALVELSRQATARIQYEGEHANLTVTRVIDPPVVRSGNQASVTYELFNSGNVDLTDIRVQETISKTAKSVKTLAAGERTSITFTSRIGNADLKSSASITYKITGETKTQTYKVEEAVIAVAKPNLKLELSSDVEGVNVGETATLIVTFTNAGNVAYTDVSVKDATRGEILSGISIPAGATVTQKKEFALTEPATFKVTATLPDNTGETKQLTSNELRIGVYDPEKQLLLTLNLTADQETVAQTPADVKFHLKVTNNSNITAEKIRITHGTAEIFTINSLASGASTVLDRDVRISQAGQFRFTATLKDSLNNEVTFESNTIRIAFAQPTAAPTTVPVVTVPPPELVTSAPVDPLLTQGRDVLRLATLGLAGLFGLALVLFSVSSLIRLNNRRKSKAAFDHLDLAERRDYTEPAEEEDDYSDEDEDYEDGDEEIDAPQPSRPLPEDEAPLDEESLLPHEKLLRSVQSEAAAAPDREDMPRVEGDGGYRISRASRIEDAPIDVVRPSAATQEEVGDTDREFRYNRNQPDMDYSLEPQESTAPVRRHRRASRRVDEE